MIPFRYYRVTLKPRSGENYRGLRALRRNSPFAFAAPVVVRFQDLEEDGFLFTVVCPFEFFDPNRLLPIGLPDLPRLFLAAVAIASE